MEKNAEKTNYSSDLVSIIMPSFNTAKFIGFAIDSLENQTYKNWELIIVDDCSTDNSVEVVNERMKKDDRIRVLVNSENCGAAQSRNLALREANGRYVAFLDSDDFWFPNKLEKQIAFMRINNYDFSYTAYDEIYENGDSAGRRVTGPKKITERGMKRYCWPGCLTVIYDARVVGLIQIADLKKNNDYAQWLKVSARANCYLLDETLASYRKREGSISCGSKLSLIKHHYKLFRNGENMSVLKSLYWTVQNLIFGVWKKLKYVKKLDRCVVREL